MIMVEEEFDLGYCGYIVLVFFIFLIFFLGIIFMIFNENLCFYFLWVCFILICSVSFKIDFF